MVFALKRPLNLGVAAAKGFVLGGLNPGAAGVVG